ncbi:TlpA disulfide reductase family protein [Persicobacter sp. CCB-QB2]|uniref:TlpA disulfide reductase family protein n=1 Tax=Persicobacter sp. CCB-QB2 TaxID=1561025 RepID=UPI0006A99C25|nr:TlpA disulfide reductase family protein [Persicobacter sp. CCB-QB2]
MKSLGLKKSGAILSLAALAWACDGGKAPFTGSIEGEQAANVDSVYLLDRGASGFEKIAAAAVTEGKFTFSAPIAHNGALYLQAPTDGSFGDRKPTTVVFYQEGDALVGKLNADDLNGSEISGGLAQTEFNTYKEGQKSFVDKMKALSERYQEIAATAQGAPTDEQKEELKKIGDEYGALDKEANAYSDGFINEHTSSMVSPFLLRQNAYRMDEKELKSYLEKFTAEAKTTADYTAIEDRYNTLMATAIGQPVLDFELTTPEGESFSTTALHGKVFLIDFWASWCGPCRQENPNVVAMYNKYHDQGFEILGVSLDNKKEAWEKAIAKDQLTWNHVSDLQGWQNAVAKRYGINSIPATVLVDASGKIVAKNLRGEELENKVAELLSAS